MDLTDEQKNEITKEVKNFFDKHKDFLKSLTVDDLEKFKSENDLDSMSPKTIYMAGSISGLLNGFMFIATQIKLKEL